MSSFTETSPVNMSNERDWANNLGMLDWDSTSIVFTKRSLMEFLKYTGTTVDTNFNNIQKLPRYVKFGKISDAGPGSSPTASTVAPATSTGSIAASPSSDFKPTRRVRDPPGGHRTNIFADEDVLDALSMAPPKEQAVTTPQAVATQSPVVNVATTDEKEGTGIKPSRRVREAPGGNSTLGRIWGDDEPEETKPSPRAVDVSAVAPAEKQENTTASTGIKPSRRVREAPGGNSTLGSIWGNDEPEEFKPTRRVRQAPGGGSSGIF